MKNFNISRIDMIVEEKIKPNMVAIYDMKVQGLSDKQIGKYLGISAVEFSKVLEYYEPLKDIYEGAMDILRSKLRAVVIKRALGEDGKVNKDGEEVGADANLAFRILEKIDNEFRGKVNVDGGNSITIENIIMQVVEARQKVISEVEVDVVGEDIDVDEL